MKRQVFKNTEKEPHHLIQCSSNRFQEMKTRHLVVGILFWNPTSECCFQVSLSWIVVGLISKDLWSKRSIREAI